MLLEVNELRIALGGQTPVDGLSFSLDRGQRLGLIGVSGSGKSLVALALAGLLPAGSTMTGSIKLGGAELSTSPAALRTLRRKRIVLLRQDDAPALNPLKTAAELVPDAALLSALGLSASRFVSQLTPAERQMLLVGTALQRQPDLLILDEPFTLLDATAEKRLVDLLATQPMAMLAISHDFPAVAALVQTVMIVGNGKLIESGPTAEIFSRPRDDYSKHLIASSRIRARTLMRSPIGTELLELRGVTAVFPDRERLLRRHRPIVALDDVSFTLRRGEALAIVGAAGSGKTTLARLVAGLGRARKGVLAYERQAYRGRDLPRLLRQEISLVFSDPRTAFSPSLTLAASVTEPLLLDVTHTIEEQSDWLVEVMRGVGLTPEYLDLYPRDLNLYDLQLMALARSLVTRPKLVVLDEPVKLLNARQRGDMLVLINRLRADFGFSAIFTASSLELIRHVADRALILDAGRIVDEGRPGELLETPHHPATQALADARLPEVGIGVVAPVGR